MLSKLTVTISYMLCVDLHVRIHNCYLVIFTGKSTGQFFVDKSVSLTETNMYLLVVKVFYDGRKTQIFYSTISPTSAHQIRRYRQ